MKKIRMRVFDTDNVQEMVRILYSNFVKFGLFLSIITSLFGSIVYAGPSHYDFTFLLKQAHPFELVVRAPKAKDYKSKFLKQVQTPELETYEERVNRWLSERGSTFVKLIGVSKSETEISKSEPPKNKTLSNLKQKNGHRFQVGFGVFDVTDTDVAGEFRAEWHGKPFLENIRPLGGLTATSDEALYGYLGIVMDIPIIKNVTFSPSFAPGIYLENSGKKLGSLVEFRSMAEISYKFQSGSRLGLSVYHLSNAGLTQYNPGVEVVTVCYTFPLEKLFMFSGSS